VDAFENVKKTMDWSYMTYTMAIPLKSSPKVIISIIVVNTFEKKY